MKISYWMSIFFLVLFGTACQQNTKEAEQDINTKSTSDTNATSLVTDQKSLAGVEIGNVSFRDIASYIECSGKIDVPPGSIKSVYSPVTGFVKAVKFIPGDYVAKGTLLTALSHPELIHLQRELLEVQGQLEFLEKEFERKQVLLKQDAGSERAFEEAKSKFKVMQAHSKGLIAELNMIGISTQKLLEEGHIQDRINLYAPASGFITKVNVNPGKLVEPTNELFEIINIQNLHLELQVFTSDLNKIKKGQKIDAQIPGSGEPLLAKVLQIGKTIDKQSNTAIVHGHIENKHASLAVGTYLPARIHIEKRNAAMLPEEAIVREEGETFVYLSKGDQYERVKVKTGISDEGMVELIDWKYPEETQVVTKGAYYIPS